MRRVVKAWVLLDRNYSGRECVVDVFKNKQDPEVVGNGRQLPFVGTYDDGRPAPRKRKRRVSKSASARQGGAK